jgi:3D (Asp-Asp-Asp) domain-containing protein
MMKKILFVLFTIISLLGINNASAEWIEVELYAYTLDSSPNSLTATGEVPHVGGVATNFLPLGTRVMINNNWYVVNDICGTNGAIDIYMDSLTDCYAFGVQRSLVYVDR